MTNFTGSPLVARPGFYVDITMVLNHHAIYWTTHELSTGPCLMEHPARWMMTGDTPKAFGKINLFHIADLPP